MVEFLQFSSFMPFAAICYVSFSLWLRQRLARSLGFTNLIARYTYPFAPCQQIGVFWCEFVSAFAMRFSSIYPTYTISPSLIFLMRYSLDMNRANANTIATQMVAFKRKLDVFNENTVNKTVSAPYLSFVFFQTVSRSGIRHSRPFPTRRSFVKIHGRNFDFGKYFSKNFAVSVQTVRIVVGHINSSVVGMIRAVLVSKALLRPVFIVA